MQLPVIPVSHDSSQDDLVRMYHRTHLHWARHLGEESGLDVGTAIVNPSLSEVPQANCVLDASIPDGADAEHAVREADEHFSRQRSHCRMWVMNPSALPAQTDPLKAYLLARGFSALELEILHVAGRAYAPIDQTPELTIIPARASFRHARELADQWAAEKAVPQLAEAAMLHLDDPHVDALLALKDGQAVASVAVLAVGDIGSLRSPFVSESFRGRGIEQTMMNRAMEICARSVFKHIFVGLEQTSENRDLFERRGFTRIGLQTRYVR